MNEETIDKIIQLMIDAAKAVVEDESCSNSDYGGYAVRRFEDHAREVLIEILNNSTQE